MTSDDALQSPPYPGYGTTTGGLYRSLEELYAWTAQQRQTLNDYACRELIAAPKPLPRKTVYEIQPVYYQFACWLQCRRVREAWDATFRDHELSWSSPESLRRQIAIVMAAVVLLNTAFVPFEVRETKQDADDARLLATLGRIFEDIKGLTELDADRGEHDVDDL
jgi:hypothetical protein